VLKLNIGFATLQTKASFAESAKPMLNLQSLQVEDKLCRFRKEDLPLFAVVIQEKQVDEA